MTRVPATRAMVRFVRHIAALVILAAVGTAGAIGQAPAPGQNVNMVSGTQWPGGDPFLQRQNEPSIAVSSRNPLHLLAGANDYRTVDLPISDTVPGSLSGDAWLGVFKSYDGGQTWQSYLLAGYPQDNSLPASPLKAYLGAADPTVRAGTGGVLYYSGIAFNRGTNNGGVFVSTFFDTNRKENGSAPAGKDAIQYQNTVVVDTGTSGQFLDKTWIATDIPRPGAGTCTFNAFGLTQTVTAGNVYVVWSRFTGSQSTKIMFSRSLDCGKTWSNPTKLSESSSINQGTNVAIDPTKDYRDVMTPGHVFPLVAKEGGVLIRAGHTEAAIDLARLAGLYPAGVICEIMNDDGTMARLPDLVAFLRCAVDITGAAGNFSDWIADWFMFTELGLLAVGSLAGPRFAVSPKSPTTAKVSGVVEL